jgi:hypothetical protein
MLEIVDTYEDESGQLVIETEDGSLFPVGEDGRIFDAEGEELEVIDLYSDPRDAAVEEALDEVVADEIQAAQDFVELSHSQIAQLEHRLGRSLTNAEFETVIEDMKLNEIPDAIDSYVSHYGGERNVNGDLIERQKLIGEIAQDSYDEAKAREEAEAEAKQAEQDEEERELDAEIDEYFSTERMKDPQNRREAIEAVAAAYIEGDGMPEDEDE